VRADYTAGEVRRLAKLAKDGAQSRRLLAIAAVLDGASRSEAAKIGGTKERMVSSTFRRLACRLSSTPRTAWCGGGPAI